MLSITGSHIFILFYHGLSLYAFILPLATARGKIFGIKWERENTTNSTSTRKRTQSQKTSGSLCSQLQVFIWRHVVYVPKLSTTFRGILICVIFRPRDMQSQNIFVIGMKYLFGCHFKHLWKKTEYYCNISVGSINGTANNTGWPRLLRFENVLRDLPLVVKYSASSANPW
jgi:hypothetical protein